MEHQPIRDTVTKRIEAIAREHMEVPFEGEISEETSLIETLKIDSLDAVTLLLELESSFDIDISAEEASTLAKVKDVVDLIITKLEAKDKKKQAASDAIHAKL